MCGRYALHVFLHEIEDRFDATLMKPKQDWTPRFNIAPTQVSPVILEKDGKRKIEMMRWGLVPSWAKDKKIGSKMINARSETVFEKPSFRNAVKKRRCIVPASSFYEWKIENGVKTPMRIFGKVHALLGLAGLYEFWNSPEGEILETYTILTTSANQFMGSIHDRMPVILQKKDESQWLDIKQEPPQILFEPSQLELEAFPVSKLVNSPKNDIPECIEPLA